MMVKVYFKSERGATYWKGRRHIERVVSVGGGAPIDAVEEPVEQARARAEITTPCCWRIGEESLGLFNII